MPEGRPAGGRRAPGSRFHRPTMPPPSRPRKGWAVSAACPACIIRMTARPRRGGALGITVRARALIRLPGAQEEVMRAPIVIAAAAALCGCSDASVVHYNYYNSAYEPGHVAL